MTLERECGKRLAMLRRRSNSSPLFVTYVLTGKDFTNVQKAVFAIVHNDDDTKPISVDLWDIYKAAPHFAPKKIFLGKWSSKEWRPSRDGSHQEPSWKEPLPNSEQERMESMPPSLEWKDQQQHDLLPPFFTREPWERRSDLMGLVLRCTTLQVYPYIMYDGVNEDGTVSFDSMRGINGELFHVLKQIMNFTPHCFENVDQTWGSLRDGKWIGMVADLVEDRADIAVSDVDLNYVRSQAIDYPFGWQTGGYSLLMRHDPAIWNARNSYTKEFTWQVWLMVVMFGIILCLSLFYVLRHSPHSEEMRLSEVIWLTVAAFCYTGQWNFNQYSKCL
ncbi:probable glutamate receptor [Palaemon carinicauda]|uniref:probable glutamate receptor n=1 Tax=Palaemon carinicauda TaxID=392227 RepID=UPI0035B67C25